MKRQLRTTILAALVVTTGLTLSLAGCSSTKASAPAAPPSTAAAPADTAPVVTSSIVETELEGPSMQWAAPYQNDLAASANCVAYQVGQDGTGTYRCYVTFKSGTVAVELVTVSADGRLVASSQ